MGHLIFKFFAIAIGAAFFAGLAMARKFLRTGEDPADDGPHAVIAEFAGYWIACMLIIWSFTHQDKSVQWTLRGIAAVFACLGLWLANRFASMTEVEDTPDKEPTGFKNDSTGLHLE
jgi:hypothetical protein